MTESSCFTEIISCFLLSIMYVGSLYIWNSSKGRNHSSTIKKRCISVVFMTIISPLFMMAVLTEETRSKGTLWEMMGLRTKGLLSAFVLPLLLTMILFLGPLYQNHLSVPVKCTLKLYVDPYYWLNTIQNPIWWRNQVVAPFSEELTYRVCMLPVLLQCISPGKSILIATSFFGFAHLHHAIDMLRTGIDPVTAVLTSCVQFAYTSLFGIYSAFLFIRTGHFLPLFVVHAFCNHLGLPEIREMLMKPEPIRRQLMAVHVAGLIAWYFLLFPMTEPSLYENHLFSL